MWIVECLLKFSPKAEHVQAVFLLWRHIYDVVRWGRGYGQYSMFYAVCLEGESESEGEREGEGEGEVSSCRRHKICGKS